MNFGAAVARQSGRGRQRPQARRQPLKPEAERPDGLRRRCPNQDSLVTVQVVIPVIRPEFVNEMLMHFAEVRR